MTLLLTDTRLCTVQNLHIGLTALLGSTTSVRPNYGLGQQRQCSDAHSV